ncbi:MAG: hypothetical protein WCA04_03075 [Geobacteraceae bacterium]
MAGYQQARKLAKTEEVSTAILQIQPENMQAMAILAFLERVKATRGDNAALEKSRVYGEKGFALLSNRTRTDGVTESEFRLMHSNMRILFQLGALVVVCVRETLRFVLFPLYLRSTAMCVACLSGVPS